MADFGGTKKKWSMVMLSVSIDAEYTFFIRKFQSLSMGVKNWLAWADFLHFLQNWIISDRGEGT